MVLKITREQIRAFFITSAVLLSVWIFMGHFTRFEVMENSPEGQIIVSISFLAPMNHKAAADRLTVTCEDFPGRKVAYRTRWVSRNTIQVAVDESEYPRGLQYRLEFKKAPALLPPFTVSARQRVRNPLSPRVIALDPPVNVPTGGPLVLVFNTPVDPESFRDNVTTTAPVTFAPLGQGSGGEASRPDYSRWVLTPKENLANSTTYNITLGGGLRGTGGGIAPEKSELTFTTAPALEIAEIYPRPNDPSVWISRQVTVRTNIELKEALIEVKGVKGEVSVRGNTAVFDPDEIFMPAGKYNVKIGLTSIHGEKLAREFSFGTTNLGDQRWIGIKLGKPCTVRVYEGNKALSSFEGWLTINQDRVPHVTMYEVSRGSSLEYNPNDTSPVRYIKLNADIMVHHQRPGESHNHGLSGLSPCYGCILVNKPDMDWIISNVPAKCMVVVH